MILIAQIIFWLGFLLIIHSYIIYPFLLNILSKNKSENKIKYNKNDELPSISIIMAVFNEEKIIEKKINSVFNTSYPKEKIEFIIGSDNSSDNTVKIIKKLQNNYKKLYLKEFKTRQGKIKIINKLADLSKNKIIISTDAKVIFRKDTIFRLIEDLKNNKITIVGGIPQNTKYSKRGISVQENYFMNREIKIKYNEGVIWQHSIGIYGALYAIRKKDFKKVPENLIVDDFYQNMKTLVSGGKVIFNKYAIATENLPTQLSEEFKRKIRIATGNFQNLKIFSKYLLKPFNTISFAFISHKVIRWIAPFIFSIMIIALFFLWKIELYKIISILFAIFFVLPLLDLVLEKLNINIKFLRMITHFIAMNIALIIGLINAIKGVKNTYWKPSNRIN